MKILKYPIKNKNHMNYTKQYEVYFFQFFFFQEDFSKFKAKYRIKRIHKLEDFLAIHLQLLKVATFY